MYNISFMGVDEADKLQQQGLAAFIAMAVKSSGNRWSELDAEVYYNKVMTDAGLLTESLPVDSEEQKSAKPAKANSKTASKADGVQSEVSKT